MRNTFTLAGSISGCMAVILGAFAAHSLKAVLSEESLRIFHTGVEYQFYHSFALIIAGMLYEKNRSRSTAMAGYLFLIGLILFSGSLYLLSYTTSLNVLGVITPIGGLCLIGGWISLAVSFMQSDKKIPSV